MLELEKMYKERRNGKLRRKYSILLSLGVPSAVARTAHHWSDERICKELGVDPSQAVSDIGYKEEGYETHHKEMA